MSVDTLESLIQQGRDAVRDYKFNSASPTIKLGLAISCFKSAVLLSPPSSPYPALIQLGYSYAMLAGVDPPACEVNAECAVQVTSHALSLYQDLGNPNYLLEARIYDALGCAFLQRYSTLGCFEDCERAINAHRICLDWTGQGVSGNVKASRQYHLALALDSWARENQGLEVHQEIVKLLESAGSLTNCADSIGLYTTFLHTTATKISTDVVHISTSGVIDDISHYFDETLQNIRLSLQGYPFPRQSTPPVLRSSGSDDQLSERRLQIQLESIAHGALTMFEISLQSHTRNMGAIQLGCVLLACAQCYRRADMFDLATKIVDELLRPDARGKRTADLRLVPGLLNLAARFIQCKMAHGYDGSHLLALCESIQNVLPRSHVDRRRFHFCMGESLLGEQERLKNNGVLNLDYLPVIEQYRTALRVTPDWHPSALSYVARLSVALDRSYYANHNQADYDEGKFWLSVLFAFDEYKPIMEPTQPGGEIHDLFEATQGRRSPAEALAAPFVVSLSHRFTRVHDLYVAMHAWQLTMISNQEFEQHNFEVALQFNNRSIEIYQHLLKRMRTVYLAPENSLTWDISMGGEIETHVARVLLLRSRLMRQLGDMPKAIAAINKSIIYFTKSLKNELPTSPDEVFHSHQSSRAYYFRYVYLGDREDLETSIQKCRNAVGSSISLRMQPEQTLDATLVWVDTAKRTNHESALDAYDTLVCSLARMVWVGWDLRNRYNNLKELPLTWVGEAVLCAISEQKLGHAVELFESGRSILFSQSMPLRNRNTELERSHPELLAKLERVGKEIEKLSFNSDAPHDITRFSTSNDQKNYLSRMLRTLGEEWDELVFDVRAIPGHEDFLQTIPIEKLCLAARKGPVALIVANESTEHCYAIVVTKPCVESARLIQLPALYSSLPKFHASIKKALAYKFRQFRSNQADPNTRSLILRARSHNNPDAELSAVLSQLWHDVMSPIIQHVNEFYQGKVCICIPLVVNIQYLKYPRIMAHFLTFGLAQWTS